MLQIVLQQQRVHPQLLVQIHLSLRMVVRLHENQRFFLVVRRARIGENAHHAASTMHHHLRGRATLRLALSRLFAQRQLQQRVPRRGIARLRAFHDVGEEEIEEIAVRREEMDVARRIPELGVQRRAAQRRQQRGRSGGQCGLGGALGVEGALETEPKRLERRERELLLWLRGVESRDGGLLVVGAELDAELRGGLRNLVEEHAAELLDHGLGVVEGERVDVVHRGLEIALVLDEQAEIVVVVRVFPTQMQRFLLPAAVGQHANRSGDVESLL